MHINRTPHIVRRLAEVPPTLKEFVARLEAAPFPELLVELESFSTRWDRPRGDLCAWVPLLNRFDTILEEFVKKYALDQEYPQVTAIDPNEEALVVGVLQFSSFLLERCSNRGIYASVKHLASLTSCLSSSIVSSALWVCVQLAHRFAQSRAGKSNVTAVDPEKVFKLASFLPTSHWETPDKTDISYLDYLDPSHEWSQEWSSFSIQYFVKSGPAKLPHVPTDNAGSIPSTPTRATAAPERHEPKTVGPASMGLSTYHISATEVSESSLEDLLKKLYAVLPKESWFEITCKARLAKACSAGTTPEAVEDRKQLLRIQMAALAFATCTFSEPTVEGRLLSRTPNLIRQISLLLYPKASSSTPIDVPEEFAILGAQTLDFVCHQPARRSDVLAALSANVSHGTLMSIIRDIIRDLKEGARINEDFTSRIFTLVLQISFTQSLGSILVTAGLVQLLVEIIQIETPFVRTLASAMELLDHVIIDVPSTFSIFSQAGGLLALVAVTARETDYDISPEHPAEPSPDYCVVDYSLSYHRSQWLRSLFVVLSNILLHTRTTENIHNLVDSPLLRVSKIVITHPQVFGSRVVSLDLQILASMLENEPSSFAIMMEAKLVGTVLDEIPSLLERSNSYFTPIAKLIGALSHNENGLKLVQDREMITTLVSVLSRTIVKNESLHSLGSVFEAITADHTELRKQVISECLKLAAALPKLLEPVSRDEYFYLESELPRSGDTVVTSTTPSEPPEISTVVTDIVGFFDGLLKNHLTRVQFINQKGVGHLLHIFELKNIPYDFAFASTGYNLGKTLRSLFTLDIDSDAIQRELIARVVSSVDNMEAIISQLPLDEPIVRNEAWLDSALRALSRLNALLQAFFQMVFYDYGTGYRVMFVLDKLVSEDENNGKDLIGRLAAIQRWCVWQETRAISGLSALFVEATTPLSVEMTRAETEEYKRAKEAESKLDDASSSFFKSVKVFRFLTSANSSMTGKILSEFAAICATDRAVASRKKNGFKMADRLAQAMVDHLNFQPITDLTSDVYSKERFQTLISLMAVIQKVMFKSWNSTWAAYLAVFAMFKQKAGIQRVLDIFRDIWNLAEPKKAEAKFAQKVCLTFLGSSVNYRSLLENGRIVSPLFSVDGDKNRGDYFNPNQFFVECRIIVLNSLLDLWKADSLTEQDHQVSRLLLDILTKMFSYTGEDGCEPEDQEPFLPRELSWKTIPPSESKVEALVNVGFTREASQAALASHADDGTAAFEALTNEFPDVASDDVDWSEVSSSQVGWSPLSANGSRRLALLRDLNDLRENVKNDLTSRVLTIIQAWPQNVFAASSVVTKAYSLMGGARSERQKEEQAVVHQGTIRTILLALTSYNVQDSEHSKSIGALVHFLALLIQDHAIFQNCFHILVESFDLFLGFLQSENSSVHPWYPHVLLLIERIISNVEVPEPTQPLFDASIPRIVTSVLPKIDAEKSEAVLQSLIVPHPFKDDISALATARLLVHFAKTPQKAAIIKENCLANLLESVAQFADSQNLEKLQTAIMIILRYSVETRDMIRQQMTSEIKSWFGPQHAVDATIFVKAQSALICRSPEIFIEVTSELCTLYLYDSSLSNSNSNICLKEYLEKKRKRSLQMPEYEVYDDAEENEDEDQNEGGDQDDASGEKGNDLKAISAPSTPTQDSAGTQDESKEKENSGEDVQMADSGEGAPQHSKVPTLEDPSGIMNLLLSSLMKLPRSEVFMVPERTEEALQAYITAHPEGAPFNPSERKSYIYCCFLLKCILELLGSYKQCKLEFLSFSNKAVPKLGLPATFKPRTHSLNYFICELFSTAAFNPQPNVHAYQEWSTVSGLSVSCILSLLTSTGETGKGSTNDEIQNEAVLSFVRKFTLDTIAKILKETTNSQESLDWKYGLLCLLSDVCYRTLGNRPGFSSCRLGDGIGDGAAIAKIMYDKKFAAMFTANIGSADLNYPHIKKVVKMYVRYLFKLSRLTLDISDQLERDPDSADEDDMEGSDEYDSREDTPDLFRNSTLGMFEIGDPQYDDDSEELEEEEVGETGSSEEMDYDDVNDEVLSDVDGEASAADDESIDYDEDDDSDESDMEGDEDEEMGVEVIVEGDEDEDEDIEMGSEVDDDDEDAWTYDDSEEEEGEDLEDGHVFQRVSDAVSALQELSGHPRPGRNLEDDAEDIIYSRNPVLDDANRAFTSEDEEQDEDEDDEESIDIEYEENPDNYFDFSNAFSRLGGIRMDRVDANPRSQEEAVANPLLAQPNSNLSRRGTPLIDSIPQADGLGTMSFYRRTHHSHDGMSHRATDLLGHMANILGLSDGNHRVDPDDYMEQLEMLLRHDGIPRQQRSEDPISSVHRMSLLTTISRWQEASAMFGVFERSDICKRVLNSVFNNIVPYAVEEARKAKELEKDIRTRKEENLKRREERDQRRREREQEKQRQKAEQEAQEAAAAAAAAAAEAAAAQNPQDTMEQDESGEQHTATSDEPRVFVSISGRDIDITGLGIDPTFLEALPADLREEAFTQHIRELQVAGGADREIEPEFLDALPDNIRDELLAQEAMDSRRQLFESSGGGDEDLDVANFLATLDPSLRQAVLLEQGDETLASLPHDIAREVRELRGRTVASFGGNGSENGWRRIGLPIESSQFGRRVLGRDISTPEVGGLPSQTYETSDDDIEVLEEMITGRSDRRQTKKVVSTASLHLVDRSGVAALIRLLYLPQGVAQRESLHDLLLNLCSNKQSRGDILNTVLHVLQDGCSDRRALERGFQQISHRAVSASSAAVGINTPSQPKTGVTPKTPSFTPSKALALGSNGILSGDISPVTVTQQILEALEYLVRYSGSVKYFFLCEHEFPGGLKRHGKAKPKGKEKESRDTKFPINMLIHLLDRPVVFENNLTLELLSSLIQEVTRSLPIVLKDPKDTNSAKTSPEKGKEKHTEDFNPEDDGLDEGDEMKVDGKTKRPHKLIDPPVIPEKNLKRISSILTAKECSSRTFQQILAVMHNLCTLPGVKDLFGKELLEQAISVGPSLVKDLKMLLVSVQNAQKGSDLQGSALADLSSGSSHQTKLLRLLTAIDYLFNSSKDQKEKSSATKNEGSEYLMSLYEQMTFGPMWGALSDCLRLIQDRQDMIHVATALLPLIEALMVICKNSSVKDVELRENNKYEAKKYDIATEPLESLFFSFTDEHRKILNQMVRNNPKLMSGSFSILFKNPKALEFDNKRRYFYRRIYSNNAEAAGTISINVRREQVFLDSYKALYFKSAEEIKSSRLNIRFQGEEGVDAGGVTREWYQVLSRQIFNPDYALFSPVASDSTTFHPNRTSWVNPEHLSFFKFIGRIIGKAVYDFKLLDCHFSRAVYKKILGKPVSIKDMETLDLDYYKSLQWMLENDITDIITETFSIEAEDYGEQKIIDLKPGGRNIPVTEENKHEYVMLVVDYRLIKSVQEQLDQFLEGFHDIISKEVVAIFDEQELELLISGMPDIDIDDWRNNTEYHNYTPSSPQIKWLWRAVRSFDAEERAKLLQFATGTSKVPLNGFEKLEGMNGVSKFNIHRDYGSKDRLPSSHTCFNQIDLPEYDSYETLRGALLTAITEGREGFGFA